MKPSSQLVALMTDFGLQDPYVGMMKGVIAGLSPFSSIVDLTHGIQAQNVLQGALYLGLSAPYFPDGTVFVAVVDPGVGTNRKAVALVTEKQFFVAPDNGLLSYVMKTQKSEACYSITNPSFMLPVQSATFHGRDIFAPVAAHLANGTDPANLGDAIEPEQCVEVVLPENSSTDGGFSWKGEVLFTDVYGNLVTSFTDGLLNREGEPAVGIRMENGTVLPFHRTYGDVDEGKALSYRGSSGFLEIGIRNGNASRSLGLRPGDSIVLLLKPETSQERHTERHRR
ncbi:MAG: SAM-dependent chlorinase/fluorinase [Chlorobiales bacterium]|nr:SAM-dependent chlorinase/fluorinase [Chlorobiales bacterium]